MRFLLLLLLIVSVTYCGQDNETQGAGRANVIEEEPEPVIQDQFVFATSGLNMRAAPSLQSSIVDKLALGTKIEVHKDSVYSEEMLIEGFIGRMVNVKHGNEAGFVFSGYLASYPPPKNFDMLTYKSWLDEAGYTDVEYEQWENAASDSSHLTLNQVLRLLGTNTRENWQEFYLIAQKLGVMYHWSSFVFAFPGPEREGTLTNLARKKQIRYNKREKISGGFWQETYTIDVNQDNLWFIEVTITTDDAGYPVIISEATRSEGSGQTNTLTWEDGAFVLTREAFAD